MAHYVQLDILRAVQKAREAPDEELDSFQVELLPFGLASFSDLRRGGPAGCIGSLIRTRSSWILCACTLSKYDRLALGYQELFPITYVC